MSAFTVTDQEVLDTVQRWLLETPNNGSSQSTTSPWSLTELIQYANDRQRRLLRETILTGTRATLGGSPGVVSYELPEDHIATRRAAWQTRDGAIHELPPADHWQLDMGAPTWAAGRQRRPIVYCDTDVPPNTCEIGPAPDDLGLLQLVYAAVTTPLSNTGVRLSVPDEFTPYVIWGVLADALSKEGPGQDLPRATYAEERFLEGVTLGRLLLDHLAREATS